MSIGHFARILPAFFLIWPNNENFRPAPLPRGYCLRVHLPQKPRLQATDLKPRLRTSTDIAPIYRLYLQFLLYASQLWLATLIRFYCFEVLNFALNLNLLDVSVSFLFTHRSVRQVKFLKLKISDFLLPTIARNIFVLNLIFPAGAGAVDL